MEIISFHSFVETQTKASEAIRYAVMNRPPEKKYNLLIDLNLTAPEIGSIVGIKTMFKRPLNNYLEDITGKYKRIKNIRKYLTRVLNNNSLYFILPDESIEAMEKIGSDLWCDLETNSIGERLKEIFEWCKINNFEKIFINCPAGINSMLKQIIELTEKKIISQIIFVCPMNGADNNRKEKFKKLYPDLPVTFFNI